MAMANLRLVLPSPSPWQLCVPFSECHLDRFRQIINVCWFTYSMKNYIPIKCSFRVKSPFHHHAWYGWWLNPIHKLYFILETTMFWYVWGFKIPILSPSHKNPLITHPMFDMSMVKFPMLWWLKIPILPAFLICSIAKTTMFWHVW